MRAALLPHEPGDKLNNSPSFRGVLRSAEKLTMASQRLIAPRNALAREYGEADLSPIFRSNGTRMPGGDDYARHVAEQFANWRLIFLINVPVGLLALLVGLRALPAISAGRPAGALDTPGIVLGPLAFTSLSYGISQSTYAGWTGAPTLGGLGIGLVALALFVWRELHARRPMVDLRLFSKRPVMAGFATNALTGGALIVAMINVPLFTNAVQDGTAFEGGLNLMRLTLALAIGAVSGGLLTSRIGPTKAAALGLVCAGAGFLGMSRWDADPGFLLMTVPLFVSGLGFGLVIAPVNTAT